MSIKQSISTEPIVKEVLLKAPVSVVWKAITDKDEMKEWYFDLNEFKPEPGFKFSFIGGTEEHQYIHLCKITDVIPERKLTYTWKYEGYPGESVVSFMLIPEGENTRLRLTHEGLETFPYDNPDFKKENFDAGWSEIIGSSIKKYIEQ